MQLATNRLEFAPPPTPGLLRALALAVLAHAALLAALTWGVHWNRDAPSTAVEAELWSSLPQEAAPKPVELPPPTPAVDQPPPRVAPVVPPLPDPQIALERARRLKMLQEQERLKELEKQRLAQQEQEKKRQQALRDQAKKLADEKQRAADELKRKTTQQAQLDAKKLDAMRQENLKRMSGLAGATGASTATGSAQQSAGPSAGYAGRIRASIRPNIVFTEDIAGNPTAEVEVRAAPDGTIVGRKLLKSSGIPAYDDAVLRAIDKTDKLPRDVDGRLPATTLIISFRPKD